jgi:hypothetical protein
LWLPTTVLSRRPEVARSQGLFEANRDGARSETAASAYTSGRDPEKAHAGTRVTPPLPAPADRGPAGAGAAVPASGRLAFEAWRNDKKVGEHRLSFARAGEDITVTTAVSLAIGLGPVILYRYAYHATEHWKAGRFMGLESHTEATDNKIRVTAQRTDRGVAVDSSKLGKALLAADAAPLCHWNLDSLRPPLFNPQDGKLLRLTSSRKEDSFTPHGGRPVRATKITLAGETPVEDWYDAQGLWIGLRAKAKDGSIIDYRRV